MASKKKRTASNNELSEVRWLVCGEPNNAFVGDSRLFRMKMSAVRHAKEDCKYGKRYIYELRGTVEQPVGDPVLTEVK